MKVYVHMLQHVYIHFCLCVHKSFKGTIYRDASFLESCSKVKTECHKCEKSQKETAEFITQEFVKAVSSWVKLIKNSRGLHMTLYAFHQNKNGKFMIKSQSKLNF